MKSTVLAALLVLCLLAPNAFAQSPDGLFSRNAIYLELGGQGMFYTVNYDFRFTEHFALRAGFTHFTLTDFLFTDMTVTAFPVMGLLLFGGPNHFFEVGAGVMPTFAESSLKWFSYSTDRMAIIGTAHVAYRYQPSDGGFFFRASVPAFFTDKGAGAWGGLSFGYAF